MNIAGCQVCTAHKLTEATPMPQGVFSPTPKDHRKTEG